MRYALALDVTGRDTAHGRVTLSFRRRPDAGDAVLDFRGLALDSVAANGAPLAGHAWAEGHVRIPARHLRAGENAVGFRFAARIAPAGASIIRYRDATDGARYLYTLLVPADANQLFPCFDQPDLKARVTVEHRRARGVDGVLANGRGTVARAGAGGAVALELRRDASRSAPTWSPSRRGRGGGESRTRRAPHHPVRPALAGRARWRPTR